MMRKILLLGLVLCFHLAFAQTSSPQPLPPEQAFIFSMHASDSQTVVGDWKMAPGYYLYQERFQFQIKSPQNATLGAPVFPQGIAKSDTELGNYHVYKDAVTISIPVIMNKPGKITLRVTYQGCSESGFCYPPITKLVNLNLATATPASAVTQPITTNPQNKAAQLLAHKNLFLIILGFLGFGLLLAFTPCVLPMIPILSGIILGHGKEISTAKAFRLSLIYVLSMSFTYAIAGILVGYLGGSLQAIFQKPWVIILFSIIFILLAISLFGFYHLQPPKKLEIFIARLSGHQKKGTYIGVAIMGCLGTLIVSPCVTPPLIAALSYIGQTGNAFIGGIALFATGLGMGIPLLLIGTSGAKFLPRTGYWMNIVKIILGILMLAVAILLLSRILPGRVTLILWGLLLIGCAVYMGALTNGNKNLWKKFWRVIGLAFLIYGALLIIGGTLGNSDPFKPFNKKVSASEQIFHHQVKTLQDFQQTLAFAQTQHKPVMLDFYAEWCLSCKVMDRETFSNEKVQAALNNFIVVRADVTANDANDKALMQHYNVIAPPTILFFTANGVEQKNLRIVGEMGADQFLLALQQAMVSPTPKVSSKSQF